MNRRTKSWLQGIGYFLGAAAIAATGAWALSAWQPRAPGGPARVLAASTPGPLEPLFRSPAVVSADVLRAQRQAGLQRLLETEALQVNGRTCVHVRTRDGIQAGVGADDPVDAASVIKVPIMVTLEEAWETGALKRTAADVNRLRLMITRSKNIPANALMDELGMERINACMQAHGYPQTRVRARILAPAPDGPNTVTAAEMTRMFEEIEYGRLVSPRASAEMRKLLLDQHWRERIPAELPAAAVVGNKTGTLNGVIHDAAFVEPPDGPSYTLAILVERFDRSACDSTVLAGLSRRVYEYLTGDGTNADGATADGRPPTVDGQPLTPP